MLYIPCSNGALRFIEPDLIRSDQCILRRYNCAAGECDGVGAGLRGAVAARGVRAALEHEAERAVALVDETHCALDWVPHLRIMTHTHTHTHTHFLFICMYPSTSQDARLLGGVSSGSDEEANDARVCVCVFVCVCVTPLHLPDSQRRAPQPRRCPFPPPPRAHTHPGSQAVSPPRLRTTHRELGRAGRDCRDGARDRSHCMTHTHTHTHGVHLYSHG